MKVIAKEDRRLLLIDTYNTQNENKVQEIEIQVPEKFADYNKKIVFITPDGVVWDVIQDNQYEITNAITKYESVDFYLWLTQDDKDYRTVTKTLNFYPNIDASDEITQEEIDGVNTVINMLEAEITKVENLNITANKVETTTTLTITDKEGNISTIQILDGRDGDTGATGNGIESIEKTATSGLIDTYTITYTNGTTITYEVKNGEKGDTGDTGQNGYTPIRGTDYWTVQDIATIEAYCNSYIDAHITDAIGGEY